MKRITQSLFEEIQKITTSEQLDEKLKHDEDGDGDQDAADYMMKRRKAGGQSHAQAHAATRKHNEETEQDEVEQLDEIGDTPAGKQMLGKYIKKRTKQLPAIETNYQMTPYDDGPMGSKAIGKYKKKVNKGIGRAVDRLTKEEAELEEAGKMFPGTPEYEKAFPKESKPGQRRSKQDYGYRGPSGSETEDKPSSEEGKTRGKGRRKVREETIVKHDDFEIVLPENVSFKDFLSAARSYVENDDDAVLVAESFFKDEDISIIVEHQIKSLYAPVVQEFKAKGFEVSDIEVSYIDDAPCVEYTVNESEVLKRYVHHGSLIKGEE
jgi:hypothetical protein